MAKDHSVGRLSGKIGLSVARPNVMYDHKNHFGYCNKVNTEVYMYDKHMEGRMADFK